jgi:hypothetical protein
MGVATFPHIFPNKFSTYASTHAVRRITTLSLQTTLQQRQIISDSLGLNPADLNRDQIDTLLKALLGTLEVKKEVELINTVGLGEELHSFLGPCFVVTTNQAVLGKTQPFCQFATSQPDMMFHHISKFVCNDTLYALCANDEPMSPGSVDSEASIEVGPLAPNMICGCATEDKVRGARGEPTSGTCYDN